MGLCEKWDNDWFNIVDKENTGTHIVLKTQLESIMQSDVILWTELFYTFFFLSFFFLL